MVLENIYRHREKGEGKVRAASVGAREITFAAAATTLAIVAIFLPVAFMKGIIGKFFFQFGVTISVAVLLSLLEALTLAPMRCSRFLEVASTAAGSAGVDGPAVQAPVGGLPARARAALCTTGAWVLVGALRLLRRSRSSSSACCRQEFVPTQDMSRFTLRFLTPVGTSLDATDRVLPPGREFLISRPGGDALLRDRSAASAAARSTRATSSST